MNEVFASPIKRLIAITVTALSILVIAIFGIFMATGVIGGDSGSDGPAEGEVATVSDVPDGLGTISRDDYEKVYEQTWKSGGLKEAPEAGSDTDTQVRDAAMNSLLDQAWLTGEAAEQGVSASDAEVEKELASIRKQQFAEKGSYEKFLKESGYSEDDVLAQVELQVLSQKIQEKVSGKGNSEAQQTALTEFTTEYQDRWTARTTCADDFVVDRCENAPAEADGATGASGTTGTTGTTAG